MLVQESTAVLLIEHRGEPPWTLIKRLHVLDLNDKDITGLCTLDLEWTGEVVYTGQVTVLDVIGTVVVLDLTTGPVNALDFDGLAGDDLGGEGN